MVSSPPALDTWAPSAPRVTTTVAQPCSSRAAAPGPGSVSPVSRSSSPVLTTTSGSASNTSWPRGRTGDGFTTSVAPHDAVARAAAAIASSGISKLTTHTSPPSSSSSAALTSSGVSPELAPGATTMKFSPSPSTQIIAKPVSVSSSTATPRVSMSSSRSSARLRSPASSCPTAPTIRTGRPSRAAATATFAPLPPPERTGSPARTVAPGAGSSSTPSAMSRLIEPTTQTVIGR